MAREVVTIWLAAFRATYSYGTLGPIAIPFGPWQWTHDTEHLLNTWDLQVDVDSLDLHEWETALPKIPRYDDEIREAIAFVKEDGNAIGSA